MKTSEAVLLLLLTLFIYYSTVVQAQGFTSTSSEPVPTPRIIGGRNVPEGRFPYMCSLRANGDRKHVCGGVFIEDEWVLTAAHCVDPNVLNSAGKSPAIFCGIHDIDENDPVKTFFPDQSCLHNLWDGFTENGYDIALLKLNRKATFQTARLNQQGNPIGRRDDLAAIGWGVLSNGVTNPSPLLQFIDRLRVYPTASCDRDWPGFTVDANLMLCTTPTDIDTCQGDSGGPLIRADTNGGKIGDGSPAFDIIVGLTSFGSRKCGDGVTPSIYTNIGHYRSWIDDVISGKRDGCQGFVPSPVPVSPPQPPPPAPPSNTATEADPTVKRVVDALRVDDSSRVRKLIEDGVPVQSSYTDITVPDGLRQDSLLHWAVRYNAINSAEVLIDVGADVNSENVFIETPLHHCCLYSPDDSMAQLLLDNKAIVDVKTTIGQTPLHFAASTGKVDIVRLLLLEGADVDSKDNLGQTPLFLSVIVNTVSVSRFLILVGADVNAVRLDSSSVLTAASFFGHLETAQVLVDSGASKTYRQDNGMTAFDVICGSGTAQCSPVRRQALANLLRL